MINTLYMRETIITINGRTFSAPLTRHFDVPFDDTKDLNTIAVDIYNLKESTINDIKKDQPLSIQAGYRNDKGVIFDGIVQSVLTTNEGLDKITKITCMDDSGGKWTTEKIKKTYKGPINAKVILEDLIPKTGLSVGELSLPKNFVYQSGKTFDSLVSAAILAVAKDCNAKVHVNKRKIFIRGKDAADKYAIEVSKETGLIGSPTPLEGEETSPDGKETKKVTGWKITTLLNHRLTVDSLVQLKSKTANGVFRVGKGKHLSSGDNFYTESEVHPLEGSS
jgi:hypothetical protein